MAKKSYEETKKKKAATPQWVEDNVSNLSTIAFRAVCDTKEAKLGAGVVAVFALLSLANTVALIALNCQVSALKKKMKRAYQVLDIPYDPPK